MPKKSTTQSITVRGGVEITREIPTPPSKAPKPAAASAPPPEPTKEPETE